ncbi:MAG: 39S ribosomal protein L38, mitochondrial, partial [Paramarteilia canceri]
IKSLSETKKSQIKPLQLTSRNFNYNKNLVLKLEEDLPLDKYYKIVSKKEYSTYVNPILEHYNIIQDLFNGENHKFSFNYTPSYFEDNEEQVPISHGNFIKPTEAMQKPIVKMPNNEKFHTILMVDLDCKLNEGSPNILLWL